MSNATLTPEATTADSANTRHLAAIARQAKQASALYGLIADNLPPEAVDRIDWAELVATTAVQQWKFFHGVTEDAGPHRLESECLEFLSLLAAANATALMVAMGGSSYTRKDAHEVSPDAWEDALVVIGWHIRRIADRLVQEYTEKGNGETHHA